MRVCIICTTFAHGRWRRLAVTASDENPAESPPRVCGLRKQLDNVSRSHNTSYENKKPIRYNAINRLYPFRYHDNVKIILCVAVSPKYYSPRFVQKIAAVNGVWLVKCSETVGELFEYISPCETG